MASNTKLLGFQKEMLEEMRETQKGVIVVHDGKTTIAYREFPNTVEFALSVASNDEKKFRAKVGEYQARLRLDDFETVKMAKYDFYNMMEFVYSTIIG